MHVHVPPVDVKIPESIQLQVPAPPEPEKKPRKWKLERYNDAAHLVGLPASS